MVGVRAKQAVLIEEEEKGCGPTSPGFWDSDGHVTSTTRTWLSLSLRNSAESPDRVMVASQAKLSWAIFWKKKTASATSSCSLSLWWLVWLRNTS